MHMDGIKDLIECSPRALSHKRSDNEETQAENSQQAEPSAVRIDISMSV